MATDKYLSEFEASMAMEYAEKARTASTRREQAEYERKAASAQSYSDVKASHHARRASR